MIAHGVTSLVVKTIGSPSLDWSFVSTWRARASCSVCAAAQRATHAG